MMLIPSSLRSLLMLLVSSRSRRHLLWRWVVLRVLIMRSVLAVVVIVTVIMVRCRMLIMRLEPAHIVTAHSIAIHLRVHRIRIQVQSVGWSLRVALSSGIGPRSVHIHSVLLTEWMRGTLWLYTLYMLWWWWWLLLLLVLMWWWLLWLSVLLLIDPLLILQIGTGIVTEEVLRRKLVHHLLGTVRCGGANLIRSELKLLVERLGLDAAQWRAHRVGGRLEIGHRGTERRGPRDLCIFLNLIGIGHQRHIGDHPGKRLVHRHCAHHLTRSVCRHHGVHRRIDHGLWLLQ